MRRIISVLALAAVKAAMVVASTAAALASPVGPGPNSYEATLDQPAPLEGAYNFGHCQSEVAQQQPGSAEGTQYFNPAQITKGGTLTGVVFCPRS